MTSFAAVASFFTSDGVQVRYRLEGEGSPLLVCHGGPNSVCDTLAGDLVPLCQEFQLILHDYRGSGESATAPGETYTFERLADDLDELRRHLGLGAVPVLAHSMGGLVALHFALRHPAWCTRLVLVGVTPCMASVRTLLPMIRLLGFSRSLRMTALGLWFLVGWSWRSPGARRTAAMYAPTNVAQEPRPELREVVAAAHPLLPVQNENAPRLHRAMSATDLRARLSQIGCQVLVIYGSRDAMMVVGGRMLEQGLGHCQVIRLNDVGHEAFVEDPDEVFRQIRAFLVAP